MHRSEWPTSRILTASILIRMTAAKDPFETPYNVARTVTKDGLYTVNATQIARSKFNCSLTRFPLNSRFEESSCVRPGSVEPAVLISAHSFTDVLHFAHSDLDSPPRTSSVGFGRAVHRARGRTGSSSSFFFSFASFNVGTSRVRREWLEGG